ncbi:MAG: IS1595 family transposase [Alphaproteobacteria bacterium]|nr:IS1595 family transposase [Alphaproteobacteria bacterium]MBL6954994.1 IS1595 family transposase [Alphaproteobacteria bacterium]
MTQHFLLSAKARTLSVAKVARMSDEEARQTFRAIRWAGTDGEPVCPKCDCAACYAYASRPIFKCKACHAQFSVTSGTIFASRKLDLRDYLLAIALFVNGAKGMSALQLSRNLDCQYKTAFVMAHKLREAMAAETVDAKLSGEVEVDGAYFGGHIKPANVKSDRIDRRLAEHQTGKRRVVVIMRQREGRSLPFVFRSEDQSVPTIRARVESGTTVFADEAAGWDELHASYEMGRVNHSVNFVDELDNSTNWAESYFSRLRRAEIGTHHHISGRYLGSYAREMAWREDHRRQANGNQFAVLVAAASSHPVSRQWKGYWQKSAK